MSPDGGETLAMDDYEHRKCENKQDAFSAANISMDASRGVEPGQI